MKKESVFTGATVYRNENYTYYQYLLLNSSHCRSVDRNITIFAEAKLPCLCSHGIEHFSSPLILLLAIFPTV